MAVGLVTSAKFTPPILQAFYAGLRSKGYEADPFAAPGTLPRITVIPLEADGKYDDGDGGPGKRQELYNIIQNWNTDTSIELIVAVGGLVAAHAANKFSAKPFLLMYGTTPPPPFNLNNPRLRGAVNLDLIRRNVDRNAELCTRYGITDPRHICLIWNENSKMGKIEKKEWVNDNGWPLHQKVSNNREADIARAIEKAEEDGAKGVVISGDPFFTSRKDIVVAAANDASPLKFCYPFEVYKDANPAPTPGSAVIFGPSLETAYSMIGEKAGTIVAALKNSQPAPDTGTHTVPTGGAEPLKKKGKKVKKKGKKATKKKTNKKSKY
jgi:hypothetical protein